MTDMQEIVARAIDPNCAGLVYAGRAGTFPCSRQGRFQEGGKSWCSQHAPSKVAERHAKANKKYDEKWKAIDAAKLQAENKIWNSAIEAAAELADNEEEPALGEMPPEIIEATLAGDTVYVENAILAGVRSTKKCIAAAIRKLRKE